MTGRLPIALLAGGLVMALSCAGTNGPDEPAPAPEKDAETAPSAEPDEDPSVPETTPEDDETADRILHGTANVDSVDLLVLESFPLQVRAQVTGTLSDACTEIGEIDSQIEGDTIAVTIATERPAGAMCAQVIRHFEETIDLPVRGLEAGTYTVDVNGVTEQITFERDNRLSPDR